MKNHPTVAFYTLGCKLNYTESGTLAQSFMNAGYRKVSFEGPADVYVINTCTVTENADRECRTIINRALRNNPEAFIAVTGCYAQLKPERIAAFEGVDLIAGAAEKFNLVRYVSEHKNRKPVIMACEIDSVNDFVPSFSDDSRTRAFLKVQDGCDYNCSFCTIPLARGKSRSNSIERVVEDVKCLAGRNVKEVVLTGVNLGDFHYSTNGRRYSFFDLLCVLEETEGIERFRISSIEPNLLTDEIIRLVARSGKFMPHFHIPLQSGSDRILKRMKRRYLTSLYRSRIESIKSLMPFAGIGVDVITGFPGETDADFRQTLVFLEQLEVSYLHVFTYSERDHTHALQLDGSVPPAVRKERTRTLRQLSDRLHLQFMKKNNGRKLNVLFESQNREGRMEGYSENYIRVSAPFRQEMINQIVTIDYRFGQPEPVYD